jgi:hypothetical protein
MESFTDMIKNNGDERERILDNYIFKNEQINNFQDFKNKFENEFGTSLGNNTNYDEEDLIILFESEECKNRIRNNLDKEEYEKIYGDGYKIERIAVTSNRMVVIKTPKVEVKTKKGKVYSRFKPQRFTPAQKKFIAVRKQRKISVKETIKQYNEHFRENPRSEGSIKSKYQRE